MATRHVSARLEANVVDRLEERSELTGHKRPELMTRYIDEGLRMEDHPGIVFRSGPGGRRAALAAGPDVWEVIRVVRNTPNSGERAIDEAAEWLGFARAQVDIAVRYYSVFTDEIDRWLQRVDADAERAEQEWRRRQEMLG